MYFITSDFLKHFLFLIIVIKSNNYTYIMLNIKF